MRMPMLALLAAVLVLAPTLAQVTPMLITGRKAHMVDKLDPKMDEKRLTDMQVKVLPDCPATQPKPIPWIALDLKTLYKITKAGMTLGKPARGTITVSVTDKFRQLESGYDLYTMDFFPCGSFEPKTAGAHQVVCKEPPIGGAVYFNLFSYFGLDSLVACEIHATGVPVPKLPPAPAPCKQRADIVFIIDASASINGSPDEFDTPGWPLVVTFLKDLAKQFTVGKNGVHIGAVVFSSRSRVEFNLANGDDLNNVLVNIDMIKYDKRSTNIAGGLQTARTDVFGKEGDRDDVPNTAILITDGVPNIRKRHTLTEAEALKKVASVVTLGVTPDVDEEQLAQIASDPKLFILADDFTKMRDVVNKLASLSCDTAKPKECNSVNCRVCEQDSTEDCKICKEGFHLLGKACKKICTQLDKDCAKCDDKDKTKCAECKNDFFLDAKKNKCKAHCKSTDKNCLDCKADKKDECKDCKKGFYFNTVSKKCAECNLKNCLECSSNGDCKQCVKNFFKKGPKECVARCTMKYPGCEVCFKTQQDKCEKCKEGMYWAKNGCKECKVKDCEECRADGKCRKCKDNYFVTTTGTCKASCTAVDGQCKTCVPTDKSKCAKCKEDLYLNFKTGKCTACTQKNCKECKGDGSCAKCNGEFFVDGTGTCKETCKRRDKNCLKCKAAAPDRCQECKDDLIERKGTCEACDIKNCQKCNKEGCAKCDDGHFWNDITKECMMMCTTRDKFCEKCNAVARQSCDSCKGNRFINIKDNMCAVCTLKSCEVCRDTGTCKACKTGFYITKTGCKEICTTRVENCVKCHDEERQTECKQCKNGFNLIKGVCTACTLENCLECGEKGCVKCRKEFFIEKKTGKCKQRCTTRDQQCKACDKKDPGKCAACENDRFISTSGMCLECGIENCQGCKPDGTCKACVEGFFLAKGNKKCNEFCGNKDQHCDKCSDKNPSICEKCQEGFFRKTLEGVCEACGVKNCKQCPGDKCNKCKDGFTLGPDEKCQVPCTDTDKNCEVCFNKDITKCETCRKGFFVEAAGKPCQECKLKNCEACKKDGCTECDPGFVLNKKTKQCKAVCTKADKNCKACHDNDRSKCTKCKGALFINKAGICSKCAAPNCDECKEDGACKKCSSGFFRAKDGKCTETCTEKDPGCKTCAQNDKSKCVKCKGELFVAKDGKCTECKAKYCDKCWSNGECEECSKGHFGVSTGKDGGKKCAPLCTTRDASCLACDKKSQDKCAKCKGFHFVNKDGKCQPCKVEKCSECRQDGTCNTCTDGYFTSKDRKQCKPLCTTADDFCKTCNGKDESKCVECKGTRHLAKTGTCNVCKIKNCDSCKPDGNCKKCQEDFFSSEEGAKCLKRCTKRDAFCKQCEAKDESKCAKCKGTRYLDDKGLCAECKIGNCERCKSDGTCQKCDEGFDLKDNGKNCEKTPEICPKDCLKCKNGACLKCEAGLVLRKGACKECGVKNCDGCNEDGTCKKCSSGFFKTKDGKCAADCTRRDELCLACDKKDRSKCIECKEKYRYVDKDGNCERDCTSRDKFCDACDKTDKSKCAKCKTPRFLSKNGKCQVCKVKNCDACKADGSCQKCKKEYFPAVFGEKCLEHCTKRDPFCKECKSKDKARCAKCKGKRYLNKKGQCAECNVEHCDRCNLDGTCKLCQTGFRPKNGGCKEIPEVCRKNCLKCKKGLCLKCAKGFELKKGTCEKKPCTKGCAFCKGGICQACNAGWVMKKGVCKKKPNRRCGEGCSVCGKNDVCEECDFGWYQEKGICKRKACTVKGCERCFPNNGGQCLDCRANWVLSNKFQCIDDRTPCEDQGTCNKNATCSDGFCECGANLCGDGVNACRDRCICRLEGDPEILTYDRQVILLTGTHKYTLTKDMVNASDACSFNVEIKVSPLVRQQRVQYATTMPRFLDIDILGFNIHLGQNHKAFVAEQEVDVSKGPYNGEGFVIREQRDPNDPSEDFIVFESKKCGIVIGFYGNNLKSVAIVDVPCKYGGSGRLVGLCGDCDGRSNDLRTLDGTDVSGRPNMFAEISSSFIVNEATDHAAEVERGLV